MWRIPGEDRMTERVTFTSRDGDSIQGAFAAPTGAGPAPAIVVLQEYWGVNDHICRMVERFAAEGFLAVAPDLYHGVVTADAAEASALLGKMDWPRAVSEIAGATAWLRKHPRSTGKVAVVGFCMGGALAFAAAASIPDLACAVPFYGVPSPQDWSKVTAPVQAHFAATDQWASPDAGRAIQAAIEGAGKSMELHVYDAQHAFMNDSRPTVYSTEHAPQAWARALAFVKQHTA
jgi:carboxymethylenebutenolidase